MASTTSSAAVDRDSLINHANVATTCGKCHFGVEKTYNQQRTRTIAGQGRPSRPRLHRLPFRARNRESEATNFKALSDERCGKCHADRLEGYRDTYHGKAVALGKPNVAPASCRLLRLPRLPRHPAALRPSLAPLQGQHSRHLPAMSCQRHHRVHAIQPPRQSDGRKEISAAPRRVLGHDGIARGHVRLLRIAYSRMAFPLYFPLPARLETIPRSENPDASRR